MNDKPLAGENIREFEAEASKLLDLVREVGSAYAQGDLNSAASVASLSHYNLGHLATAREGVIEALEEEGGRVGKLDST